MRASRFSLYVARRFILVALVALATHFAGRRLEAQEFIAPLFPTDPIPGNSWYQSNAFFFLRPDNIVEFYIRFGYEAIIPSRALILSDNEEVSFDLGPGTIIVHSPGPWPNGYDGATQFTGAFPLANSLIDDFRMSQSTLRLEGTEHGDFVGSIVQVPDPCTAALSMVGILAFGVPFLIRPMKLRWR